MGYKEDKEGFVSGFEGSSVTRVNLVCLTALTTYALYTVVHARRTRQAAVEVWRIPTTEFAILVLPLLFALTLFSSHVIILNVALSIVTIYLGKSPPPLETPPLSPMPDKKPRTSFPSHQTPKNAFAKPFVTSYRAIMMVMTVVSILAVDFAVFPREFSKTETWGTSLMDLGVGSFVFSLGVVSALPLLRRSSTRPYFASVLASIKKSLPIIALGMVRVIMVKGVEYPEHVTEYGVHWNFFFTMALIPVFGTALERLATSIDLHWVGLFVSFVHQLLLSRTSLQSWTLEAERTSLISQNKEGLVSFPGYLAIHLLGLASGLYILPPDPYFFQTHHRRIDPKASREVRRQFEEKRSKVWKEKPGKLANLLGSYAVVWWTCYFVARWFGCDVSRRLANLSYVLWVVAFNTSFLFLYLVVHLTADQFATSNAPASLGPRETTPAPAIFEAINRNGLVVFLAANLSTGLINVSIETMYTSNFIAMSILVSYSSIIVALAWFLRHRRFKL